MDEVDSLNDGRGSKELSWILTILWAWATIKKEIYLPKLKDRTMHSEAKLVVIMLFLELKH